jgi:hypothetical protein
MRAPRVKQRKAEAALSSAPGRRPFSRASCFRQEQHMTRSRIAGLAVAAALATLLGGCIVVPAGPPAGEVVAVAPPPPQAEVVTVAPAVGWLWIAGYWNWYGGRHVWVPGRWVAPRPGYHWAPHHWERSGPGWRQNPGHWERG